MVEEKKSSGSNTWIWVIVGIVVLVCGCTVCGLGAFGGFGYLGVSALGDLIKESPAYTEPLARAKANEEVVAALGEPIQDSFNFLDGTSQFELENNDGNAALTIALTGPNGTGNLRVEGEMTDGVWSYTVMEVQLSNGTTVDLLNE